MYRATTIFTILCLASGVGAAAQAASREAVDDVEASVFRDTVRVGVVNVEVRVTDKKGNPITDLELEDFELFEDGVAVDITHFSRITGNPPGPAPDRPGGTDPNAAVPTLAAHTGEAATPVADPLWLVIYVDSLALRQFERNRALEHLSAFVGDYLAEGTQVMVASFNRSLSVLQQFTTDTVAVAAALDRIQDVPSTGARHDSARWKILSRVDVEDTSRDAVNVVRPHADEVGHETNLTINTLETMIGMLAGLPGRKAILYAGGGLSRIGAGDLFYAVEHKFKDGHALYHMMNYDYSTRYEQLGEIANARGVALHMLDAAGLRGIAATSMEGDRLETVEILSAIDMDIRSNLQEPLQQLADLTGGSTIRNRNDALPALQDLAADLQSYYSPGLRTHTRGRREVPPYRGACEPAEGAGASPDGYLDPESGGATIREAPFGYWSIPTKTIRWGSTSRSEVLSRSRRQVRDAARSRAAIAVPRAAADRRPAEGTSAPLHDGHGRKGSRFGHRRNPDRDRRRGGICDHDRLAPLPTAADAGWRTPGRARRLRRGERSDDLSQPDRRPARLGPQRIPGSSSTYRSYAREA